MFGHWLNSRGGAVVIIKGNWKINNTMQHSLDLQTANHWFDPMRWKVAPVRYKVLSACRNLIHSLVLKGLLAPDEG